MKQRSKKGTPDSLAQGALWALQRSLHPDGTFRGLFTQLAFDNGINLADLMAGVFELERRKRLVRHGEWYKIAGQQL